MVGVTVMFHCMSIKNNSKSKVSVLNMCTCRLVIEEKTCAIEGFMFEKDVAPFFTTKMFMNL